MVFGRFSAKKLWSNKISGYWCHTCMLNAIQNFFSKVWCISFKDSDTGFRNRKWNYWSSKWNYFSYLLASKKKFLYQKLFYTLQGFRNRFRKQEMELLKQEMELFLLPTGLQSKYFFNKVWSIPIKVSETGFRNRKWNYFSYLQASNKKKLLTKFILYTPRIQNQSLIQTIAQNGQIIMTICQNILSNL